MAYHVNVVSNEGHTEYTYDTKEEAVEGITDIANRDHKWVYIGANFVETEDLTVGHIKEDETITLTNPLIGG